MVVVMVMMMTMGMMMWLWLWWCWRWWFWWWWRSQCLHYLFNPKLVESIELSLTITNDSLPFCEWICLGRYEMNFTSRVTGRISSNYVFKGRSCIVVLTEVHILPAGLVGDRSIEPSCSLWRKVSNKPLLRELRTGSNRVEEGEGEVQLNVIPSDSNTLEQNE